MKNRMEAVGIILIEVLFSIICLSLVAFNDRVTNSVVAAVVIVSVAAVTAAVTIGADIINPNAGSVVAGAAIAITIVVAIIAGAANIFTDAVVVAIVVGAVAGVSAVVFSRAETKEVASIIWIIFLWFIFALPFFIGTILCPVNSL